ncbi:hypothetical protein [Paenibacillus xanthanilyticus]|uniref:Alpha-L-rhamnosidase six-hairpin glycosidase domain-containing protein n=1 Tax=Paenibacillus xanthanilyticus TaxID=1783531 RepID=A0ABV8KC35_9BACL
MNKDTLARSTARRAAALAVHAKPGVQRRQQKGYWFMSAYVKNPLSAVAYTNSPVGIFVSFDKGECPSVDYISVLDPSGTEISYQWEDCLDTRTELNYGEYSDGSLRHGTIWINADLAAGETKLYTIKIWEFPVTRAAYTSNVAHTMVSAKAERFVANGITAEFTADAAWCVNAVYRNSTLISLAGGAFGYPAIIDGGTYTNTVPTSANSTVIKRKVNGSGVVFREWDVTIVFNAYPALPVNFKVRMWANGKLDFRHEAVAGDDIASGAVSGVIMRLEWSPSALGGGHNKDTLKGYLYNNQLIAGVRHNQFESEFAGAESGWNLYYGNTASTTDNIFIGCRISSPNTKAIPKGAFFSASMYMSFYDSDHVSETSRRMNPVYTRAAWDTVENLQEQFVELAKKYVKMAYRVSLQPEHDNEFGGLQAYMLLAMHKLYGKDLATCVTEARDKLFNIMNTRYKDGVNPPGATSGYIKSWSTNAGWEFIGRDTAVLHDLREAALEVGNTAVVTEVTNWIHQLADAAVSMEVTSGAGKMKLHNFAGGTGDNYNARSSAMMALAVSLKIAANATRQATYDRLAAAYPSAYEHVNKTPYMPSTASIYNSIFQATNHYHLYNLWELFRANRLIPASITLPSVRQYAYEMSTASGQIREMDTNHQPNRRGGALTSFYAAALLAQFGGNASDYQHAIDLLEHVLSRIKPSGHLDRPMDGWGLPLYPVDDASYPIEAQTLIETVYLIA